jgi:hypothetical protein
MSFYFLFLTLRMYVTARIISLFLIEPQVQKECLDHRKYIFNWRSKIQNIPKFKSFLCFKKKHFY